MALLSTEAWSQQKLFIVSSDLMLGPCTNINWNYCSSHLHKHSNEITNIHSKGNVYTLFHNEMSLKIRNNKCGEM